MVRFTPNILRTDRDVRGVIQLHLELAEQVPEEEIQLAPGQAVSASEVSPASSQDRENTYLIPRHVRGPFENAAMYWSRCSSPSQRSGKNSRGCGKMVGLRCTNVAPMETTAYQVQKQKSVTVQGLTARCDIRLRGP